ncbi:recombinase family protein [Ferroacidibacillus organovorans]|uniref:Recombinase domain-containing protein n=1 Tax=Ferroacidibacillus organovorans TaxID=1765683 RepID=A0A853KCQ7_9BACL|nr:recombinase family protein [Ferroacidibacillus organovorans]KYP81653.1 hypothetical protein AYJ22_06400 [Ferroacidibacillus organovorans]OAG94148.1 hypothetical protein AYW79_06920 [Ferroacidibacillus organovorans]
MQQAIGYCRRSDAKQENNHSIEIQMMSIKDAAKRFNVEIVEFYVDDAVSAYAYNAKERLAMKRLKDRVINDHNIKVVLFYDESRISRQIDDFVNDVFSEIKELRSDVIFYSTDSSTQKAWDPNDFETMLQLLLANEESTKKSSRAMDSQKNALRKNKPVRPGSKAPYGFTKEGNTLVHNDQAPIVYFIFHMASYGYSEEQIAQYLNRAEIPSPSNGLWAPSSINMIVTKRVYVGDLEWYVRKNRRNGARSDSTQISLFPAIYEPIIPLDLWALVQELKMEKKTTKRKMNSQYILQGLLKCGHCFEILNHKNYTPGKAKKQYANYSCESCGYRMDSRDVEERIVKMIAKDWEIHPDDFVRQASGMLKDWIKSLEKEISTKGKYLQYAEAESKNTPLSPEINDSIEAVHQLINDKEKLKTQISLFLSTEDVIWKTRFGDKIDIQSLNTTERRTFLFQIVEEVQIRKNANGGFTPKIVYRETPFIYYNKVMKPSEETL